MKTKLSILLLICSISSYAQNLHKFDGDVDICRWQSTSSAGSASNPPLRASSDEDPRKRWQCGDDAWAYLEGKTLKIWGNGSTYDYHLSPPVTISPKPWDDDLVPGDVDTIWVDVDHVNHGLIFNTQGTLDRDWKWGAWVKYIHVTSKAKTMSAWNFGRFNRVKRIFIENNSFSRVDICFYRMWGLEEVVLPNTLTFVGDWFLMECPKLRAVQINTPTPPSRYEPAGNFGGVVGPATEAEFSRPEMTLLVPDGSVNNYLTSPSVDDQGELTWGRLNVLNYIPMSTMSMKNVYGGVKNVFDIDVNYTPPDAYATAKLIRWELSDTTCANVDNAKQQLITKTNEPFVMTIKAISWNDLVDERTMTQVGPSLIQTAHPMTSINLSSTHISNANDKYEFTPQFTPSTANTVRLIKWEYDSTVFTIEHNFNRWLGFDIKPTGVDTFGVFPLKATSWEGLTAETTIHLLSTNETITDIKVKHLGEDKEVSLNPDAANFHAQVHVPEDAEEVTVNPVPRHSVNTLRVRYLDPQGQWQLAENGVVKLDPSQHSVPVEIRVQSEHRLHQNIDDELGKFYELEVIPDPSTDARAGSLNVILIDSNGIESQIQLVPEFHPDVYEYELISDIVTDYNPVSLMNNIKQIRLEGSNYHPRAYKPDSTQIDIYEGENKIVLRVQAQHPDHHSEYAVKIWRISLPRLSRLTVDNTDVLLLPGQYKYELQVPADQARIHVQAQPLEHVHHVSGIGYINLNYGFQQIPITVTGFKDMKQIYRLNITREGIPAPTSIPNINRDNPVDVYTITGVYLGKFTVGGLVGLKKHKVVILKTQNNIIKFKL